MMEAAFQRVSRADIYAQTGIQFLQLNTLYQLYSMALHNSPQLQIAATFLTMPDLLNYWLTGAKVCEFTNATTTQCYDQRRAAWARPLLQRLSIPDHIFPEVVRPGTLLGPLRPTLAEELGVQVEVIAPACHDTGSAVAAIPAEEEEFLWISSGTWSIMGVNVREPVINERTLAAGMTNEGGAGGSTRFSKNIMGLWPVQESRRAWRRQGREYSYDDLTRMAAGAEPLRSPVDVDSEDFLKPGDMPARLREVCQRAGLPIPESEGQVVRAFTEAVALKYRATLERIEALLSTPQGKRAFDTIHIVGGGTKNRLLSQFAADATGRRVVTGPVEGTAVGNLLVQAAALGELSSLNEAREVVCQSFAVEIFEPDPSRRAAWDDAYAKIQQP
jgi:rhamnulokinase